MTPRETRRDAADKQRQYLIWSWAFVVLWTGGTAAAFVYTTFMQGSAQIGLIGGLITGPLAAFGLYMVWRMVRITADDLKFGVVSLTPSSQPANPGGTLEAVLRFHDRTPDLRELDVELRCLRVTLTKRSRTGIVPVDELFWRSNQRVSLRHDRADVKFAIPADAPVTDLPGERRGESGWQTLPVEAGKPWVFHRWEVFVSASLPGIDLERNFPVIVGQKGKHGMSPETNP